MEQIYDYSKTDWLALNNHLVDTDWNVMFESCSCVNDLVDIFYSSLKNAIKRFVPMVLKRVNNHPPWYNKVLTSLKNKKNKKHKVWMKTNSESDRLEFVTIRKEFDILQEHLYKIYIEEIQEKLRNDPSGFWKYTKLKNKTSGYPSSMIYNGNNASGAADITGLFADFFKDVYIEDSGISYNLSDSQNSINFGNLVLSPDQVYRGLNSVDPKKGSGPDGISPCIISKCANAILKPLCIIFNTSLISGEFPEQWKVSHLIPIFKSGSRSNVENYRGVAISSTIPKLFEKLVCEALKYEVKSILSPQQHGFVKNRSVVTNLCEFTSSVIRNMEAGYQTDVIFTDFKKAFDRVNIRILLAKLKSIGVHSSMLNWISSFLRNRRQIVKVNGLLSSPFLVKSGVPQGSHIGPILFILFINDLVGHLKFAECMMYADDLKIFARVSNVEDQQLLQLDINSIFDWCNVNDLCLNINKCKCFSITRKRTTLMQNYHINNVLLERVTEFKDLGVILDSKLCFNQHIDYCTSKASSMLGFVKRQAFVFTDPYAIKSLYCAFVRSILEYASVLWNPTYKVHIIRIESVQKKFLRYALRKLNWKDPFILPPYTQRCQLLNIDTLEHRRAAFNSTFIFDIINAVIDSEYLLSYIYFNIPTRSFRRQILLRSQFSRTNYGTSDPIKKSLDILSTVYDQIDFSVSRPKFKKILKLALSV